MVGVLHNVLTNYFQIHSGADFWLCRHLTLVPALVLSLDVFNLHRPGEVLIRSVYRFESLVSDECCLIYRKDVLITDPDPGYWFIHEASKLQIKKQTVRSLSWKRLNGGRRGRHEGWTHVDDKIMRET